MKGLVAVLAATLLICASLPSLAQTAGADGREALAAPETQSREESLEALFLELASAPSPEEAKRIERNILEIWLQSGSNTVDLLMEWTLEAIDAEDYPRALDFLDRIITLEPGYAEAWNKRATVHFMNDDLPKSIADLEMVIALEPRHFGALAGLGAILDELEEDELALTAFRHALELDPFMDDVQEAIDDIEKESGGSDI
jgi:tetratricopeptide (TPR) repeat protein